MAVRRKEAFMQSETSEDLRQLAGSIAHDLNNLLMAISGNILVARDMAPESHKIHKFLDNADKAILRSKELTSRLGKASKADPGAGKQAAQFQAKDHGEQIAVQGRSILLMDDDETIWNVAGYMLKRLGYAVTFSDNGENAVMFYRKSLEGPTPFDAVVLDLIVDSGSGGAETIKKLAQIDPGVRAIVSSGDSTDPMMTHYRKYGFAGALCKPYGIEELGRVLTEVINR